LIARRSGTTRWNMSAAYLRPAAAVLRPSTLFILRKSDRTNQNCQPYRPFHDHSPGDVSPGGLDPGAPP
jgi:hypothetical protein